MKRKCTLLSYIVQSPYRPSVFLIGMVLFAGLWMACNPHPSVSNSPATASSNEMPDTLVNLQSAEVAEWDTVHLSNTRYIVLDGYSKSIQGKAVYSSVGIFPDSASFRIESTIGRRSLAPIEIPYTREEQIARSHSNSANPDTSGHLLTLKPSRWADHFVSERESYTVDQKTYVVYKHQDYNCYDPQCGVKHNHTTFHVGVTYFNPKFGILVTYDEARMEYEILESMDGVVIPAGLIEGILQSMGVDKKVLDLYMN